MGFFESSNTKQTQQKVNDSLIEKIKERKYYMYCIHTCYSNYVDYLNEGEKICLAKCNDNVHMYLSKNYDLIFALKSKL